MKCSQKVEEFSTGVTPANIDFRQPTCFREMPEEMVTTGLYEAPTSICYFP